MNKRQAKIWALKAIADMIVADRASSWAECYDGDSRQEYDLKVASLREVEEELRRRAALLEHREKAKKRDG